MAFYRGQIITAAELDNVNRRACTLVSSGDLGYSKHTTRYPALWLGHYTHAYFRRNGAILCKISTRGQGPYLSFRLYKKESGKWKYKKSYSSGDVASYGEGYYYMHISAGSGSGRGETSFTITWYGAKATNKKGNTLKEYIPFTTTVKSGGALLTTALLNSGTIGA